MSSGSLRQQQGARSREEILDSAERLMAERGFAAASISQLSNACGLPSSSIYWHFGSKDGVLAAVMERGAERFFDDMPQIADGDASPARKLSDYFEALADRLEQQPQFLRLLMALGLTHFDERDGALDLVRQIRVRARDHLSGILRSAYPELAEDRVDALTSLTLAAVDGAFLDQQIGSAGRSFSEVLRSLSAALSAVIEGG